MSGTYHTKETVFAHCIQPDGTYGLRNAVPFVVEATSDGAADGITVIATGLGPYASGDDDFVSNVLECRQASSRRNLGKRAMVRAFDSATNTLTVDAFPAQVKDGDEFLMFVTPDAPVVVDTPGSVGTSFQDATRDEPDDTWNGTSEEGGFYAVVEQAQAAAAGEVVRITDFAQTNGVFTVSPALSANVAVGDLIRVLKFLEARGDLTRDRPPITRESHIGIHGTLEKERGIRAGAGTLELYRRGPGTGRKGLPAEAHDMLRCTMDYIAGAISTAGSGSSGDQIVYSAGAHVPGQFLVTAQGDLAMVLADDEVDTYTVSPAPRIDPLSGGILGRVATYSPARQLNHAVTIYQWIGGVRSVLRIFWGVVPIVTISAAMNAYGNLSFAVQAADWYEASRDEAGDVLSRGFCSRLSSVTPRQTSNMRCNIGGVEFPLTSYNFTPGTVSTPLPNGAAPNWTDGFDLVNSSGAGQLVCTLDEITRRALDDRISMAPQTMLIQDGAIPGDPGILGFWANAVQYNEDALGDNTGTQQHTIDFEVIQADPCADFPAWAIAVA